MIFVGKYGIEELGLRVIREGERPVVVEEPGECGLPIRVVDSREKGVWLTWYDERERFLPGLTLADIKAAGEALKPRRGFDFEIEEKPVDDPEKQEVDFIDLDAVED